MSTTTEYKLLSHHEILRDELSERQKRNPAYSLRAFAASLGVSPAFLSQVLAGKRNLGSSTGLRLARKLRWPKSRQQTFVALVQCDLIGDHDARQAVSRRWFEPDEADFKEIREDQFKVISGWEHFAIVELSGLRDFQSDPQWIASRLGISKGRATEAIRRLLRIGLLRNQDGQLFKSTPFYQVQDTPSAANRSFHKQHLIKAQDALEAQPIPERHIVGATLSFNTKRMPEVHALIKEFHDRLNRICSAGDDHDSVYQFATQFFRLTKEAQT